MSQHDVASDPTEFGYIYDWMEGLGQSDPYADIKDKDELLVKTYNEMTANLDDPMPYDQWKELYGHYIDVYNPNQERLLEEAFDIKASQTEKLFTLKTDQEERDYDLIEKYTAIDDSDDFESTTEMSIRHSKEMENIDKKLNRYKLISEGKNLNRKKKAIQDKTLLKSIKSGEADTVVKELDEAFWDEMNVVRSQYDKQRLEKTQAINKLILKSEQTVTSAFKAKEDSIKTTLVTAQNTMQNAAVDLLADILATKEEYNEELWDTLGTLASEEAFESFCAGKVCGDGEVCDPTTGKCVKVEVEPEVDETLTDCEEDADCGNECSSCIDYKCITDTDCAEDDGTCLCVLDEDTQEYRDCLGNLCTVSTDET